MKRLVIVGIAFGILTYFMIIHAAREPNLREKIGQMLLIGFDEQSINQQSNIVKIMQKNNIGGVILFDYNAHTDSFDKNIKNPTQVKTLNAALQHFNHQGHLAYQRKDLPLLIAVDYEGGEVIRLAPQYGFPAIPSAAELGHQDIHEIDVIAKLMADTLKNNGFNFNFAPVLDVNIDPESSIIGGKKRSISSDPIKVANVARVISQNLIKQKIQCAYKHFPGHGSARGDTHIGFVDVTETWQSKELEPYRLLLNQSLTCGAVMTAHVVNRQLDPSGLPATLSHRILTGLLREQLHFDGVIISDDMQMKAIRNQYGLKEALKLAINAGVDMLIVANALPGEPDDVEEIIDLIEHQVKTGAISSSRIDDAYRHILQLKKNVN